MLNTWKVQLPKDFFEKIESLVWTLCLAKDKVIIFKVKDEEQRKIYKKL